MKSKFLGFVEAPVGVFLYTNAIASSSQFCNFCSLCQEFGLWAKEATSEKAVGSLDDETNNVYEVTEMSETMFQVKVEGQ